MEELDNTMIGRGRDAIDMIIDKDSCLLYTSPSPRD